MKKKIILSIVALVIVAVIGTWYYGFIYSKTHHRNVANEKAITISAKQIVSDFQVNESAADAKYLNKAVEVTGEVVETKTDQVGNITVTLKGGDPFASVFCTLKPGSTQPVVGKNISIKGICNGFLSDVVLNECIITQ